VKPWLGAVAGYIRAGKERGLHYADVDEEAYLIHILLLVITATASATVTSSALETDPRARHDRYDRELARIARASLFPSASSASGSSAQAPKKAAGEARKRKVSR
jgi:TetR/AcrR family transcriptional regulator